MTNREYVKEMPDVLFIKFLNLESGCPPGLEYHPCPNAINCKDCRIEWLNAEAKL